MSAVRFIQHILVGGVALAGGSMSLAPEPARAQVVIEYIADGAPPRIEAYPHTHYDDREVYLVRGRWYYQRGPHWYYYRREPPPLRHHRVYVLERPAGHRRHHGRHHGRHHERAHSRDHDHDRDYPHDERDSHPERRRHHRH
jgi:hypothetical protein